MKSTLHITDHQQPESKIVRWQKQFQQWWLEHSQTNQKLISHSDFDWVVLWAAILLFALGLIMVYSTTIALPDAKRFSNNSQWHYLWRHVFALALGAVAGWLTMQLPTKFWQKNSFKLFGIAIVLLVLVLVPFIGKSVYGARRWISLGVLNLQPSEIMKLAVVVYSADFVSRKLSSMQSFSKAFVPMGIVIVLIGILLLSEPDMGAFLVIAMIAAGVLFLGGANGKVFVLMMGMMVTAFALIIYFSEFRRGRIFAYLDPWGKEYALNKGYQLTHALIAIARGEYFGVGVGGSLEKLHYLPEAHTDFIFAVMGEEFGWFGLTLIVLLYFFLVYRIYKIGDEAIAFDRIFQGLMAKGVALWFGIQGLINMGVNTGILPTKGLTLPLISYGGSGLLLNCIAIGIVLRVDYENRQLMRGRAK